MKNEQNYNKADITSLLSQPVETPIRVFEQEIDRFSGRTERVLIQAYAVKPVTQSTKLFTAPVSYVLDLDAHTYVVLVDISPYSSRYVAEIYSVTKTGFQRTPFKIEQVYSSYAPTLIVNRGDKYHFGNWYFTYPGSIMNSTSFGSNQWFWVQPYLESNLCFYTLIGNASDISQILSTRTIQDK